MTLLDWIKPPDTLTKSHIKNLLEVAKSDGDYDKTEKYLLKAIAKRYKVNNWQIKSIEGRMDKILFVSPRADAERYNQMYDLVCMMMADGEIDHREMLVCNKYAKKLGFDMSKVSELVLSISKNIEVGHSLEETRKRIKYMLN